MSDLHLGALNSLLTSVTEDGREVDRKTPAAAVAALADCIYELHRGQSEPPELVVLGDLFELALISSDMAAATFGQFVSALRIGQAEAIVAPVVRFVPGNHDHRLWTQARNQSYLRHLADLAGGDEALPDALHATNLLPERDEYPVRDGFVELLAARANGGGSIEVHQSYPNVGLISPDGRRAVVCSHGHFVEPLYRLMSNLDIAFGKVGLGELPEARHLEAANGGWIDFFWSSMGDSGKVSHIVSDLYESLQSSNEMELEVEVIRNYVAKTRRGLRGRLEASLLAACLRDGVIPRLQRERHRGDRTLSPAAKVGLDDYLRGPVQHQLREVDPLVVDTTFVFGHTHKPFAELRDIKGYANPVSVLNTGGWVVDSPEPEANKGAAIIVVDTDANVAVVRLFSQSADPAGYRVSVTSGDSRLDNPLVEQLSTAVDSSRDPWKSFEQVISATVATRCRQLSDRLAAATVQLEQTLAGGKQDSG